jgi:hypothetical protein
LKPHRIHCEGAHFSRRIMPHAIHSGKRGDAARFPFNGMAGMCEDGLMRIDNIDVAVAVTGA